MRFERGQELPITTRQFYNFPTFPYFERSKIVQCSGIHEKSPTNNNQVTYMCKYQVTISAYCNQGHSTCVVQISSYSK